MLILALTAKQLARLKVLEKLEIEGHRTLEIDTEHWKHWKECLNKLFIDKLNTYKAHTGLE